jgi:TRAP-type C4-dicarboxylate transport system permease small subunit
MPDEKVAAVTADDAVIITDETLGADGRPVWTPIRIAQLILKSCQMIGMGLVIVLMLLTVAHVVGRYLFNYPMLGVVELSGLMVVTLVFLAAPYDFLIDRHIGVDVVARRLPPKAALVVKFTTHFIAMVVMILALIWTIRQGYKMTSSGARTSELHIPEYPFYFVVAFGWLLCVCSILARLILLVTGTQPVADAVAEPAETPVEEAEEK